MRWSRAGRWNTAQPWRSWGSAGAAPESGRSIQRTCKDDLTFELLYDVACMCHGTGVRVWCIRRHCTAALVELEEASLLPTCGVWCQYGGGFLRSLLQHMLTASPLPSPCRP